MLEVFHPFILHPHTIYLLLFNILPFPPGMSGMSSHGDRRKKILFYNGNKFCRVCALTPRQTFQQDAGNVPLM